MSRALVVDGNSLVMRCIMATALDDLRAGATWTGGVYGALNSLRSIVASSAHPVGRIVVFFDGGVPQQRLDLLPGYKAGRKERQSRIPDEHRAEAFHQLDLCREVFELLGVRTFRYKNREADDGVVAVARMLAQEDPLIVSGDHDLWQSVWCADAAVYDLNQDCVIDRENFHEIAGVHPWHYTLYRVLIGDASDSIKGAYGCGPKRAAALLEALPIAADLTPVEQVNALIEKLHEQPRLRAYERAITEDEDRLQQVAQGIDLRRSFGSTATLESRMYAPRRVNVRGFLQFCQRLHFQSVLGDPERWTGPFKRALERTT